MNMIILILVLLFAYTVKCQGLTKNSKDNGTILFKSNSLALDVSEAELSLGFTNLNKIIGLTNELFYSINLKAKINQASVEFLTKVIYKHQQTLILT